MGANLGSIYQDDGRPKGRDLHAEVALPRWALGAPHTVTVPLALPIEGELVRRGLGSERGDTIQVNVPEGVPDGVVLRLRGLGEVRQGGQPGDLYLKIALVDSPRPTPSQVITSAAVGSVLPVVLAALVLGVLAVVGWLALAR